MRVEQEGAATTDEGASPSTVPGAEDRRHLKGAAECVLLVAAGPVTPQQLAETLGVPVDVAVDAVQELAADYAGRGLQIQNVAGGFQLCTRPEFAEYVQRFLRLDFQEPLSQAALETLAIVAYRQPVTRGEIELVRGVRSEHVLERLVARRLIREVGRKPTVGRPILYGTTEGFLRHFGLRDLSDLPPLRGNDPRAMLSGRTDRAEDEETPPAHTGPA
ncbi:MAG: SMC-Scp complex subunit ScpB [Armatimonadota bacterium]|nr:SMC-Scp complex subunit ScpB [Armatimonadota bacterium]MDR7450354.1 SMC-Scp complex subunit ScpB [Armatimonadota bacterium]MDR7467063.1 SMC-Scp complex subunit ScpB [Armatimonadota bacterium]MDR7493395.1 SMC-Scp complex subunit ScpB [Armatimonadota bacterium]MDR7499403.1 SMC-Scp complex subunit ScpB [Armatimonadota bacterium]